MHTIRNVGVVAHIDAGKTTTSEQMLFLSGNTDSIGRVDNGDTVLDFLPQEKERGITISSAATSFQWKQHNINLIDTPGHVDFTIEVERSARVLDGVILVIDSVSGVQAQTQTVWKQTRKQKIPAICFMNKMDRDGANFVRAVASVRQKLGANAVPIQIPVTRKDEFVGVVDLMTLTVIEWTGRSGSVSQYQKPTFRPLTTGDAIYEEAVAARQQMIEALAENDEVLMEQYLASNGDDVYSEHDLTLALRRTCLQGTVIPTICGASLRGRGVEPILDSIVSFLPSPLDRPPSVAVHRSDPTKKKLISPTSPDLCALAFKVVDDKERGALVFVRTYAGTLVAKQTLFNPTRGKRERINQLLSISADDFESIPELGAGNVACIVGLKDTVTGDTLVSDRGPLEDYVLDGLTVPEAVYSLAIEPEKSSQTAELERALKSLMMEDPSLRVDSDKESGQTMLRGLGELHLEIVCDKLLRQFRIEVATGKAYVAYRVSLFSLIYACVLDMDMLLYSCVRCVYYSY